MSRSTLLTGLSELTTVDDALGTLRDAAVVIEDGLFAWVGPAAEAPACDDVVDLGGRAALPGWVDSHSHLVFDGDRAAEFEARMAGQAYAAGGIGVTTSATRAADDERLRGLVAGRVAEAVAGGTTYLETKTGYGLTVPDEERSARIAGESADEVTYLGAHLVPAGADAEEYTELVCGAMLDAVGPHVRWADVFCDRGAFTPEQTRRVLEACRAAGLGLRLHGNQLEQGAGAALAVEFGAASVDHLNFLSDDDVAALAASGTDAAGRRRPGHETVATVLPACDLSTRAPLAPARRLLDAGATVALASNCNPGTSYTSSMNFCVGTAVLQMHLSLEEAIRAATLGGARALRRDAESLAAGTRPRPVAGEAPIGRVAVGHRADLHVLDAPAAIHLAYRPGMPLTHAVWRAGVRAR
ncbi:amidohydrolase family protein [Zhihengliuella sp.]|uniref:amidohydrolase family protein n=1 Tax=Zhihengliuella sp. TaxID=1954483 RepID=UPI0028111030|nr:amidohydrolase family protein [Zhihengliuella sp.]